MKIWDLTILAVFGKQWFDVFKSWVNIAKIESFFGNHFSVVEIEHYERMFFQSSGVLKHLNPYVLILRNNKGELKVVFQDTAASILTGNKCTNCPGIQVVIRPRK